MEEVIQKD